MSAPRIAYQSGYKYQLVEDYTVGVGIRPKPRAETPFLTLDEGGFLTIRAGYAWDGPSGPTIDTDNFMRGSLVHDALYQLMREGHISAATYRDDADRLLRVMCREDGMSALRAWWVYVGVRKGGGPSADRRGIKPIRYAPSQWKPR